MIYREFGHSGCQVSAIGFGGMRFLRKLTPEQGAELVVAAYQAGINYFDTCIAYGESERTIGDGLEVIRGLRGPLRPYVSTKTSAETYDAIRADCETSLQRLRIEKIDFYHLWCVRTLADWRQRVAHGALDAFVRLKEEGLIEHISVSTHLLGYEIPELLSAFGFESMLAGFSVANSRFRDEGLSAAAATGMGVAVMNPLAGGIIARQPDRFGFARTRPEESVVEGALRFLLNDERIDVVTVGMCSHDDLQQAVRAVDGFRPLAPAEVARICSAQERFMDGLCTGCDYCRDCPQGLPVSRLMESYNYKLVYDSQAMVNRLRNHWGLEDPAVAASCAQCGFCEEACTQKLPITARLAELNASLSSQRG